MQTEPKPVDLGGVTVPDALAGAPRAEDLLEQLVELFHPRLYTACSFQKEASVIIDMLVRIEPGARFFTLDTGLLFEQTYSTWRQLEDHYGIRIDVYRGPSLKRQAERHGDALWRRDPDACCDLRKVQPLERALSAVEAWITGLRREQSQDRAVTPTLERDDRREVWKANPLAGWSEADVWRYIEAHDVPYNELHDRGYDSIGCTHCTAPGKGRSGRWPGRGKSDCGLHSVRAAGDPEVAEEATGSMVAR